MDLILLRPGWPEGFGVGGIDEDGCCEEWVVVERSCDVLVRMGIEGGNWKECCPVRDFWDFWDRAFLLSRLKGGLGYEGWAKRGLG